MNLAYGTKNQARVFDINADAAAEICKTVAPSMNSAAKKPCNSRIFVFFAPANPIVSFHRGFVFTLIMFELPLTPPLL